MAAMSRHSEASRWGPPADADPQYVAEIARRAANHASRGEGAKALACYREVLLIDDGRADLWFNYGLLQQDMGLRQDAAESFEFALRIDPKLYAARYCLARLLFELGRPLASMAHYRDVILQTPGYIPAWRNLARLHHAMGDCESAGICLQEAIARAPHDQELATLLAEVERDRQAAG
jgi:tetratricopeptide (TPR) repeat protein